jgi:GTPase SAR1 family protein
MLKLISEVNEKAAELAEDCASFAKGQGESKEAEILETKARKLEEDLYQIAVIGFMKRGKSTLLNALLGQENSLLAPADWRVCTAAIVSYLDVSRHPDNRKAAVVHFMDESEREISHGELEDYIHDKYNKENEKSVKFIDVFGSFPLIPPNVAIVDTPGRGSIHKEHDLLSDEFIPNADAIILVLTSDLPVEAEERKFLSELRDADKKRVLTVVTKSDTIKSDKDRVDVEKFVRSQLVETGIPCEKVYFTAALKVIEARKTGGPAEADRAAAEWGFKALEQAVEDLIQKHSDKAAIRRGHLNDLCVTLEGVISGQAACLEKGLANRKTSTEELERNLNRLSEEKEVLNGEFNEKSEEFRGKWERQLRAFKRKEAQISGEIVSVLRKEFETKDLSGLLKRKKRLHMDISDAVSVKIMPHIGELEEWFDREWGQFNEDLSAGVRNRTNKTVVGGGASDFITKTVDVAGRLSNVAAPVGAVALAAYKWSAYVTACGIARTAVNAANTVVASTGTLPSFVGWLFGSGTTAATTVAAGANASAGVAAVAATEAFTTAVLSSVGGVGACVGVYFGYKFLKNKLTDWKREDILEKLPELVEEALSSCIDEVGETLAGLCEQRIEDMRGAIFERISAVEKQEKDILEARKTNDPSIVERMKEELESVHVLEKRYAEVVNLVRAETAEYA